jgi:hypothetical protein
MLGNYYRTERDIDVIVDSTSPMTITKMFEDWPNDSAAHIMAPDVILG